MNKLFTKIAAATLGVAMAIGVGVAVSHSGVARETNAAPQTKNYEQTFGFSDLTSVSNATKQSDYWKLNNNATCVVNALALTVAYVPTSNVTFTFEVATFGSGGNPSPKISITGTEDNTTWTVSDASLSANPTSSTYITPTVVITKAANPTALTGFDLSIKTGSGKQIRFKSVKVSFQYEIDDTLPSIAIDDTTKIKGKHGAEIDLSATVLNYTGPVTWIANPSAGVTFSSSTATTKMTIANTVAIGTKITISASIDNGQYTTLVGKDIIVYAHDGLSESDAMLADEAVALIKNGLFDPDEASYFVKGYVKSTTGSSYYNTYITTNKDNSDQANNNCLYLFGPTAGQDVDLSKLAPGVYVTACGTLQYYNSYQPEMAPGQITNIKEVALDSVSVSGTPAQQYVGMDFNCEGLTFTANFDDGSTSLIENGEGITWPTLTAGNAQTIVGSYTLKGVTKDVVVENVNVKNDTFDTLTITGDMNKKSYKLADSWSPSGFSVSANYEGAGDTDVTSRVEWHYSVNTPADMGKTSEPTDLQVWATLDEVSSSKKTIKVTVSDILGLPSGRYFIYSADGALGGAHITSSPSKTDITAAKAWDFTLIADYTYNISYTENNTTYDLIVSTTASSGSNTNVRSAENATIGDNTYTKDWVMTDNGNGTYGLKTNVTGNARYLFAYSKSTTNDWRAYANESQTDGTYALNIVEEKTVFANNFLNTFTEGCIAEGGYTPAKVNWSAATTQFGYLSSANQLVFQNATYTKTGSGSETVVVPGEGIAQNVAEVVARYDLMVVKYTTSVFADFMNRTPSLGGGSRISSQINNSANIATIVIISISTISIISLGALLVLKKRKEQ